MNHDHSEQTCDIAPTGWKCTRTKGHDGPCAAVESTPVVDERHREAATAIQNEFFNRRTGRKPIVPFEEILVNHFPAQPPVDSELKARCAELEEESEAYAEAVFERWSDAICDMITEFTGKGDIDTSPGETENETRGYIIGQCGQRLSDFRDALQEEARRLREALEEILNCSGNDAISILARCKTIARKALSSAPQPSQELAALKSAPAGDWVEKAADEIMRYFADTPCGEWHKAGVLLRIRRALAESGPKQQGWRPIETAPKDQGSIMVFCAERQNSYLVVWRDYPLGNARSGWAHFGGSGWLEEEATHWRPRPEPPAASSEGGEG